MRLHGQSPLLQGIDDRVDDNGNALLDVWMSHGDKVTQLPPGFVSLCETDHTPIAGMANLATHWYGLQFHPEVSGNHGRIVIENFVNFCLNRA